MNCRNKSDSDDSVLFKGLRTAAKPFAASEKQVFSEKNGLSQDQKQIPCVKHTNDVTIRIRMKISMLFNAQGIPPDLLINERRLQLDNCLKSSPNSGMSFFS